MLRYAALMLAAMTVVAPLPVSAQTFVCQLPTATFENTLPKDARTIPFDESMIASFVSLWKASGPADLPTTPDRIVAYKAPNKDYLIGYLHKTCTMAFLRASPKQFEAWLLRHLGPAV